MSAKFAVKAQSKLQKNAPLELIAVERAEQQVVAGTNYRFCVSFKANKKNAQATAVVYQNLQNQLRLTSWTPGKCADVTAKTATVSGVSAVAPDALVRSLYAVEKTGKGPLFQKKSRVLVDKYFNKELADLLWKDAVTSNDGVGALDFDPLHNAQDTQIALFKIGAPQYGEGNPDLADVPVTFKNMGKAETILFRLERKNSKVWKISDIFYPSNDEATSSLIKILS